MRPGGLESFAVRLAHGAQAERLTLESRDLDARARLAVGGKTQRGDRRAASLLDRGDVAQGAAPRFEPRGRRLRQFEPEGVVARGRFKARDSESVDHAFRNARREQDRAVESDHERLRRRRVAPDKFLAAIGGDDIASRRQRPLEPHPRHETAGPGFDGGAIEGKIDQFAVCLPDPQIGERAADRLDRDTSVGADLKSEGALLQVAKIAGKDFSGDKRRLRRVCFGERLGAQRCLAVCALHARDANFVDALVEQRVDAAVADPRRARRIERAGDLVHEFDARAGWALGANGISARRRDGEQARAVAVGGQLLRRERNRRRLRLRLRQGGLDRRGDQTGRESDEKGKQYSSHIATVRPGPRPRASRAAVHQR